jgi:hypothetical protein
MILCKMCAFVGVCGWSQYKCFFIVCFEAYPASDITTDYSVTKEKPMFCTVNCALGSIALNI